jgi:hypothetical protein
MKYLTGHSPKILGLLDALHVPHEGVVGIRLIVELDHIVRLEIERCVTEDEMQELTEWILKHDIKTEQLDD